MTHRRARVALLVLVLGACASSSSSTTFEQVWSSRSRDVAAMQTIVTLYESPDGALRRRVEDTMARKLAQRGVRALPSYAVLEGAELASRDRAKHALRAQRIDGIVVIRLLGTQMYPGQPASNGEWPVVYEDYTFESPIVRVETTLYSVRDDELVWSAQSKTVEPSSIDEVVEEVTSLIAERFSKRHS